MAIASTPISTKFVAMRVNARAACPVRFMA
jgi:hypothetical protein